MKSSENRIIGTTGKQVSRAGSHGAGVGLQRFFHEVAFLPQAPEAATSRQLAACQKPQQCSSSEVVVILNEQRSLFQYFSRG